ncbi:Small nuclear ribonucleoprotein Sm D3 [Ceraceosorus bombacis]|uniref:Small nuclear ribonucleoprotein Sm D3 n=1 Tax=Ceraceosorus bombacis TaxID=401625 RepID=A0A0P1BM53_9BASI|nr:Small nuclear ribonucleoprotein Sm D3 [Ceraceosorus bombacis]
MSASSHITIKCLLEAVGHIVTVEVKGGTTYRGKLVDAEDSMNICMAEVTATARDGKQSKLQTCYLRGSLIRFVVVPDLLRAAPFLARGMGPNAMRGKGVGAARGRAVLLRAQQRRGRGAGPPRSQGIRR